MLETLMLQLARDFEIDAIPSTVKGEYKLPLDEGLEINIEDQPTGILMTCNIAACPKTNREIFFTQALLANLFGQGTQGAVLGLSEDGNLFTISKGMESSIGYPPFKDSIEDFINTVDFWRAEALKIK